MRHWKKETRFNNSKHGVDLLLDRYGICKGGVDMTKTEKKIQQLEHEIFLIEMKDSLDAADYSLIEEYKDKSRN